MEKQWLRTIVPIKKEKSQSLIQFPNLSQFSDPQSID